MVYNVHLAAQKLAVLTTSSYLVGTNSRHIQQKPMYYNGKTNYAYIKHKIQSLNKCLDERKAEKKSI